MNLGYSKLTYGSHLMFELLWPILICHGLIFTKSRVSNSNVLPGINTVLKARVPPQNSYRERTPIMGRLSVAEQNRVSEKTLHM